MRLCVLTSRQTDGTYVAVCPSLPGCVSKAATHKAVLTKHRDAVAGYVAAASNSAPGRIEFDVVNGRKMTVARRLYSTDDILKWRTSLNV